MKKQNTISRKKTRAVKVGNLILGDGQPIRIQSMTKVPTRNVKATLEQINRLVESGCEIVRVACPGEEDVKALGKIKARIRIDDFCCWLGIKHYKVLIAILFKVKPTDECVCDLKNNGFRVMLLPCNPSAQ